MRSPFVALSFLLWVSGAALADDAALQHCRGIADATARLACYDAMPLTPPQTAPAQANQPAAAKPAALPPQTPAQFGLPPPVTNEERDSIESTIPGHFEGWWPNARIRLANGQVWQVTDGTSQVMERTDPKVTIRRGLLGAFYLEFEGSNRTARVKRLQ